MRKLLLLSLSLILSCQANSPSGEEISYLDIPAFTHDLLENMQVRAADVSKEFILNEQVETKTMASTDSGFWRKELDLLINTDLKSPKYRGAIEVSKRLQDNNSNLEIDLVTVDDESLNLQKIEIFYLEDITQIRKIKIVYASSNFLAESSSELTIWFNEYDEKLLVDSLVAKGQDKILFQDERRYESHVRRLRQ